MISLNKVRKDAVLLDLSGGYSDSVNSFSGSSQEFQGSLLDIKLDKDNVPESGEEEHFNFFGSSCLDRLKSH